MVMMMMMMMKFVIGLIIVLCSVSIEIVESTSSPVKITRYSNSAWVESATAIPKKVEYVDSLEGVVLSEGTGPFSVTVETGIDLPDENRRYAFLCDFSNQSSTSVVAFVYLEDHLICHTSPYPFAESPFSRDGTTSAPLSNITLSSRNNRLLIRSYGNHTSSDFNVTVSWNTNVAIPTTDQSGFESIQNLSRYSPSDAQLKRQSLQNSEAQSGWSLWDSSNILPVVNLPSACTYSKNKMSLYFSFPCHRLFFFFAF